MPAPLVVQPGAKYLTKLAVIKSLLFRQEAFIFIELMEKRFKPRLAAGIISIVFHAIVVVSLTIHRPAHQQDGIAGAPAFQVALIASQEGRPGPAQTESEDAHTDSPVQPEAGSNPNGLESIVELVKPEAGAAIQEAFLLPEWTDWLPQLSNTPLINPLTFLGQHDYFSSSELQIRPSPEEPVIVPFPEAALSMQRGTVTLLVYVSAEGNVVKVEIDKSELPAEFEQAAVNTFMHVKMRPGIKDGNPVPARMKIEVQFEAK